MVIELVFEKLLAVVTTAPTRNGANDRFSPPGTWSLVSVSVKVRNPAHVAVLTALKDTVVESPFFNAPMVCWPLGKTTFGLSAPVGKLTFKFVMSAPLVFFMTNAITLVS